MKKSEDGNGLILRFYEWAGEDTRAKIIVPSGISKALETNLMEQDLNGANTEISLKGGEIALDVGAYSINTLRLLYPVHGKSIWRIQGRSRNGSSEVHPRYKR
jgi:alpha-mannosidase